MRTRQLMKQPAISLEDRVRGAISRGQFAEAVRMALDLPDHPELLFEAVLGRVRFWLESGQTNFASDLIRKVMPRLSGNPAHVQALAVELARCGAAAEAFLLAPDAGPMRALAADSAMERGKAGRSTLSVELHAGFDAIVEAFDAFRSGNDDEARDRLQSIGLGSPFLEWKLALRGLMAWQAGDDSKAIENWARLDANRSPARFIVPLRAMIEPAFLHHLPPAEQLRLRGKADRLMGVAVAAELRGLQRDLADKPPQTVIRRAAASLPHLTAQIPEAIPRLVEAIAAMVVEKGELADAELLAKQFPPLPADPTFDQLRAVVAECLGEFLESRKFWLKYERVLTDRPELFGSENTRARSIIWWHLGELARMHLDREKVAPFFREKPRPGKLDRSVEDCRQRALELAPDLRLPLFANLMDADEKEDVDATIKAGERLLQHYPNDETALIVLARVCDDCNQFPQHLEYEKRIFALRPLDPRAREKLARAFRLAARSRALAGDITGALADAESAAALDVAKSFGLLAALAWKAGDDARAEQRLSLAGPTRPFAVAARVLGETSLIGANKSINPRFTTVIAAAAAGPLTFDDLIDLAVVFGDMEDEGLTYHGAKTHAGKIGKQAVEMTKTLREPADQVARFLGGALQAGWLDTVIRVAGTARRRYSNDPRFPYFSAAAKLERGKARDEWNAESDLNHAETLLNDSPSDRRPEWLAASIATLRDEFGIPDSRDAAPVLSILQNIFGEFGP